MKKHILLLLGLFLCSSIKLFASESKSKFPFPIIQLAYEKFSLHEKEILEKAINHMEEKRNLSSFKEKKSYDLLIQKYFPLYKIEYGDDIDNILLLPFKHLPAELIKSRGAIAFNLTKQDGNVMHPTSSQQETSSESANFSSNLMTTTSPECLERIENTQEILAMLAEHKKEKGITTWNCSNLNFLDESFCEAIKTKFKKIEIYYNRCFVQKCFTGKNTLDKYIRHLISKHTFLRFQCPNCEDANLYYTPSTLNKHLQKEHSTHIQDTHTYWLLAKTNTLPYSTSTSTKVITTALSNSHSIKQKTPIQNTNINAQAIYTSPLPTYKERNEIENRVAIQLVTSPAKKNRCEDNDHDNEDNAVIIAAKVLMSLKQANINADI